MTINIALGFSVTALLFIAVLSMLMTWLNVRDLRQERTEADVKYMHLLNKSIVELQLIVEELKRIRGTNDE